MPRTLEGQLTASGLRFAIVAAKFNSFICEPLLAGAITALQQHGCKDSDITVVRVPGSFEIPITAKKIAESKKFDAIIALGAIIRGATYHYELVCAETAKGIAQVGLETSIPVTFGVITTDTIEQAIERAGTKAGNKGYDAAVAAIEMAQVLRQLERD